MGFSKKQNNLEIIKNINHHQKSSNIIKQKNGKSMEIPGLFNALCGSNARTAAHEHGREVQGGGLVSLAMTYFCVVSSLGQSVNVGI